MAILSIDRYFVGDPNIVGITTSDNISAITTAGYWTTQLPVVSQLINGVFQWSPSDIILIYYAINQVGFFTYDTVNLTFKELIVPGDVSSITGTSPILINGVSGVPKTGNVTVSSTAQGIDNWVIVSGETQVMAINTGYIIPAGFSPEVTFILPSVFPVGCRVGIIGVYDNDGWTIPVPSATQIEFPTLIATNPLSISSSFPGDSIYLLGGSANTVWLYDGGQSTGYVIQ